MAKERTTTHSGKGASKHNWREFSPAAKGDSDIDRSLSNNNKFFVAGLAFDNAASVKSFFKNNAAVFEEQRKRYNHDSRYKNLTMSEKMELRLYEKVFAQTIKNQNERYIARRQQHLQKNAIDMLFSKKTQPEETIFQIGNKDNCPVNADQLWAIYKDYANKHNERFGSHIAVLDAVLHVDETTLHIHERKVFVGQNMHGESYPGKDSALGLLGIERPDMTAPKGRYNCRKQTYSAVCRQMWLDTCIEHGLNIETVPKVYADRHGLETIEYKVQQEQQKHDTLQKETAVLESKRADAAERFYAERQEWTAFHRSNFDRIEYLEAVHNVLETYEPDYLKDVNAFLDREGLSPSEWPDSIYDNQPDYYDDDMELS